METVDRSKCYFCEKENNVDFSKYIFKKYDNMENLKAEEVKILENNGCYADSWADVLVTRPFSPELIRGTMFHGKVKLGRLEKGIIEYSGISYPIGIYDCQISDSVIDDYPAIYRSFISSVQTGHYVIIQNCGQISTSASLPFYDSFHNRLSIINEHGGREVSLFANMTLQNIWLQSSFRDDLELHKKLDHFTRLKASEEPFNTTVISSHCVLLNVRRLSNTKLGRHTVVDGAARVENCYISSSSDTQSFIGDNVIITNSVCRSGVSLESGAIADRCFLDRRCIISRCARITESAVGCCSAISCGEVSNALIFPLHQQHHNSSFLIASRLEGQSNLASGATIGSNHNSRANDGELLAGRGFWPGLCTSVKHDSIFAPFTLLAKGDYQHELDTLFPFSLVSNRTDEDALVIYPAWWWQHNMYALMRNQMKFRKRLGDVEEGIECDFMAPDTAEEILKVMPLLKKSMGVLPPGTVENSKRKVYVQSWRQAVKSYEEMLLYYCTSQIVDYLKRKPENMDTLMGASMTGTAETVWHNAAGHLVPDSFLKALTDDIIGGRIISWDEVEDAFRRADLEYAGRKLNHALSVLGEIYHARTFNEKVLKNVESDYKKLTEEMRRMLKASRQKDFDNRFRKFVYTGDDEANAVLGRLEDDPVLNVCDSLF